MALGPDRECRGRFDQWDDERVAQAGGRSGPTAPRDHRRPPGRRRVEQTVGRVKELDGSFAVVPELDHEVVE